MMFSNLDTSPMQVGETRSQRELRERIEAEYSDAAIECSKAFAETCRCILATARPEVVGYEIMRAAEKIYRYAYIKCDGYDIQIDLLNRNFMKCEHM